MITAAHIKWSVILLGVVGAFLLLFTILKGSKQHNDEMFKALIKATDSEIQAIRSERDAYKMMKEEARQQLKIHESRDSVLAIQQSKNKIEYEKVPVTVRNYNREELRSAALEFEQE